MNYFYDKTCNIFRMTYIKVDGSQKGVKSPLYSGIPCSFWKTSGGENYKETPTTRQMDKDSYNVDLQPAYDEVRKGDFIELFDEKSSVGIFIIENVELFADIKRRLDNISLTVTSRNDG